ncbi:MAG: 5'/3'-nucleotidase SurE [Firmicutes bacterium]|nr:5'/3'-nucleotidase SurE [Bacillota bacterium]
MKFLVTNDDGINASGIRVLAQSLAKIGEVMVIAPHTEKSGSGHSITVHHPLRLNKSNAIPNIDHVYMLDGTPADCVKMAIQGLNFIPDLVVSGINLGANLSTDVLYSGTVSAAIEGVILGYPSIAISQCDNFDHLDTAAYFLQIIIKRLTNPLPKNSLLNINVPGLPINQVKGIKVTKLGIRIFEDAIEKRLDPRGRPYYWLGGTPKSLPLKEFDDDHDQLAVENGYVSVTPINFDLTDYSLLNELKGIIETETTPE